MAKPQKAQITYEDGTQMRFHSVIAEGHEASTQVTKFPTQAGFNVSNHAIRQNRKVTISGIVTNNVLKGATEAQTYSTSNNAKALFEEIKRIVTQKVVCQVQTNLGNYDQVIWTRFGTETKAGMTDAMEFTLTGEEIQTGGSIGIGTPTIATFTKVPDSLRAAKVLELEAAGMTISQDAVISESVVDMGKSFIMDTVTATGAALAVTYEAIGDGLSGTFDFMTHTDNIDVIPSTGTKEFNFFELVDDVSEEYESLIPDLDLAAGISTASACLKSGAIGIAEELGEEYIETAMGALKESVYGAANELFGVNGDRSLGQVLVGLGSDCVVAGAVGTVDPQLTEADFQDNGLPSADDALGYAASLGDRVANNVVRRASPVTLTKIAGNTGSISLFGAPQ